MNIKKLLLPLILLTALLVRLWQFTAIALWHDEAFSALLIRMPFAEMMQRIALDVHPPFYYWLLRAWAYLFGEALWSLRGFSVFFGVATVLMIYVFVKSLFGAKAEKLALAAAALLAVNPFHIQYSLEARMYTLGTFLIVLSSWLLVKALKTNQWRWWLFFALLTAAEALTHYFLLFSIAGQGLFILIFWLKKYRPLFGGQNLRWLWSLAIAGLLYLPWLPTFWKQFNQVQESYWIPKMDIWSVPTAVWKILIGGWEGAPERNLILASLALLLLLAAYIWRQRSLLPSLPVFLSLVPFVLAVLVSLKTALFLDRYFIFAAVFIITVVAVALLSHSRKIGALFLTILMFASVASYLKAWQRLDVENRPGMKGAANSLTGNDGGAWQMPKDPPDKVIVSSTFIYFSYQYYDYLNKNNAFRPALDVPFPLFPPAAQLYLPGITSISQLPHFSGTALLSNQDLIGDLHNYGQPDETIALLWTTGFGGSKPEVPANWTQLDEKKFADVFPHRGDIFVTKYLVK